jgi:hypothetical protein
MPAAGSGCRRNPSCREGRAERHARRGGAPCPAGDRRPPVRHGRQVTPIASSKVAASTTMTTSPVFIGASKPVLGDLIGHICPTVLGDHAGTPFS